MQNGETRSGLLDEYDRLVTESRARISCWRELHRVLGQLGTDAGDLTARVRQLVQWRDSQVGGSAWATTLRLN